MSHNDNDNNKELNVCAPGKVFEDGSCISLDVLIAMANAHNSENEGKLNRIIKLYPNLETLNRGKYNAPTSNSQ